MAYTTINKSTDYFNTVTYTGTGSAMSITGVGFQPDWVWYKGRSFAYNHGLFDVVRGINNFIKSNSTDAEASVSGVTAFNSDGFSLGTDAGGVGNGHTFVAWNWKANGSGSSNNSGTITSTVSANTTSGFSIVTYTGNGSSSATVGHGLGIAPAMIIVKGRAGTNAANNWFIYHKNLSSNNNLIFTTAAQAGTGTFSSGVIATPTSSTIGFTAGTTVINVNESGTTYVAYCFADVKGYSKFGSYTGNGNADGTFVYTGFKPAFIITKRTDTTSQWQLLDNKRLGYNPSNSELYADSSEVENTVTKLDILSNGFKLRTTSTTQNASGGTYIYMAFAEQPLVGTNNVPATAR